MTSLIKVHKINVGDCLLHVRDMGDGPVLLLCHSLFCDSLMWNEMIVHLSDKYRVITIDARAHGKSEVPSSEFTIKDLAIDHIKVMDELSIEKAHMVGISMGGMVALNSVLLAPERVESLVLMDTEGGKPPWKNWFERWLLARTVQKTGLLWFSVGTMINRMFGSTFRKEKPLLIEEWKKVLSNLSPESITLAIDAINNRPQLISRLGEVNTRTLLIYGDEDFYTPIKSGRLIESGIRGSKMVTLQNAGHLTVVEKPEEVAAIVDKFCSNQKAYD